MGHGHGCSLCYGGGHCVRVWIVFTATRRRGPGMGLRVERTWTLGWMVAPWLGISFSNEWCLASVGTWARFVARISDSITGEGNGGLSARYDRWGLLFVELFSGVRVRVVSCFGVLYEMRA